jgi:hypothetical protein
MVRALKSRFLYPDRQDRRVRSPWTRPPRAGLKQQFKEDGHGGTDPNFSWHNLTIRREVYMSLRSGQGIDDAVNHGAKLAETKEKKQSSFFGRKRTI